MNVCRMWILWLFLKWGLPRNYPTTLEGQGLAKSFLQQQWSESTNQSKTLRYSISHPSNPIIPDWPAHKNICLGNHHHSWRHGRDFTRGLDYCRISRLAHQWCTSTLLSSGWARMSPEISALFLSAAKAFLGLIPNDALSPGSPEFTLWWPFFGGR